jgi:hypothetical protein
MAGMKTVTIKAGEVKPGDQLYDRMAYHRAACWVRVEKVEKRGNYVNIHTSRYTTSKHSREGIAVLREESSENCTK